VNGETGRMWAVTARLAAVLWILGAAGYFAAEAFAATAFSGYGYGTDLISTLGDPTVSPRASVMNGAFILQGLCFATGALLVTANAPRTRKQLWFLAFALGNGAGNVLIALVHSGQGNAWHVVGAVLAICGGNAAAIAGSAVLMSKPYRVASVALGGLGLLSLVIFGVGVQPDGAWERASVYPIFAWQILTAVYVLKAQPGAGSGSSMS
jgi:hypothetical membrane protein